MDIKRTGTTSKGVRGYLKLVAFAAGGLLLATLAVSMTGRAPAIDAELLWSGEVKRGEFIHELSAAGSLVAPEIRTVTTRTDGVVERVLVLPGQEVTADDVLVELSSLSLGGELQRARSELLAGEAEARLQQAKQQDDYLN